MVVLITYFSIVVGELVPKRIGQSHPETFARLVARPINLLAVATKPFVLLLSGSTRTLLRLLGVKETSGSPVTEEEIHAMLVEGTTAGVIESHEHTMVRNVFRLDDRQIGSSWCPVAMWCVWTWMRLLKRTCAASKNLTTPASRWCAVAWTT